MAAIDVKLQCATDNLGVAVCVCVSVCVCETVLDCFVISAVAAATAFVVGFRLLVILCFSIGIVICFIRA